MSEGLLRDFSLMMDAVRAFQKKFNQGYSGPPREMPASVASLRKKLTLEEATELVLAIDRGELDEQLDALIDQLYVLIGTALQLGFTPDIVVAAFWRVHHANMQKVLVQSRQASKRDSAWDVVKPEGWAKPDLSDLVRREK
jgi:predicted HAD superfamily Cof-like phosphohydrolase